jgi:hypothetical protein
LREPVALSHLPARAATHMQDFHHPILFQARSRCRR